METIEKRLLDFPEVGFALGISRSAVYRLVETKELNCVHIGKSVRIPLAELDRYVASLSERTEQVA